MIDLTFSNVPAAEGYALIALGALLSYIAQRTLSVIKRRKELAEQIEVLKAREARAEKIKKLDPRAIAAVVEANSAGNAWRQ